MQVTFKNERVGQDLTSMVQIISFAHLPVCIWQKMYHDEKNEENSYSVVLLPYHRVRCVLKNVHLLKNSHYVGMHSKMMGTLRSIKAPGIVGEPWIRVQ